MIFLTGDTARFYAELSDDDVLDAALNFLESIYGNSVSNVMAFERSTWGLAPNIEMTATYIAPGGEFPTSCEDVQKNIDMKVFFAGEHTYCDMRGSVHGAYISGCLLYTSPSPRDLSTSRMPSSA